MKEHDYTKGEIHNIWEAMESEKGDLVERCKKYARWTLPGICPEGDNEQDNKLDSYVIPGPRFVNQLSNKVVDAMFPHTRPFFNVNLSMDLQKKVREEAGEEALAVIKEHSRKEARFIEDYSISKLDLVAYRPIAVLVAQHLIITGNVVKRRLPDGRNTEYGIKDFGIRRSICGRPMELVLKDSISLDELPEDVQERVIANTPGNKEKMVGSTQQTNIKTYDLFTRFWKKGKRWLQEQEVQGIRVGTRVGYSERDFPCIPLTWSLSRGDNYGRGLVEEHQKLFHNLDVTGEALFDIFQISADIQWVVSPASLLDIVALNSAKRGTYHVGMPDDIQAIANDKVRELGVLLQAVERMERELSMVFLVGSGTVRDAERVTAQEIQLNALELETAFGGLYSRLALEWQQREANYLVGSLRIPSLTKEDLFSITITTGMETLSREGHLQNFRLALADLQMIEGVPEDIRGVINPLKVAAYVFMQRGVDIQEFLYTQEEMQQMQEAAQQQQEQQQNHEAAARAAAQGE